MNLAKLIAIVWFCLLSAAGHAAISSWEMIAKDSHITFTGTQNNAPVSGSFKKFTSEIKFDFDRLNGNEVKIVVDMNSIATPYTDLTDTLGSTGWFNVKLFPQAIFSAKQFKKMGNQYQASGTLTIRDKTVPIDVVFVAVDLPGDKKQVKGSVTLKRLLFGVGGGEWADTDAIKNEVVVEFVVTAVKK